MATTMDIRTPPQQLPFKTNCTFYADAGYVSTISYEQGAIHIRPYQEAPSKLQERAAEGLLRQWGASLGISSVLDMMLYISRNWSTTDVLYVMSDADRFVGCVAVDRKQFYPFLSNLYVDEEFRGKNNGERLLHFAERYVSDELHFQQARLWCADDLVDYYAKRGYVVEALEASNLNVMMKGLLSGGVTPRSPDWGAASPQAPVH